MGHLPYPYAILGSVAVVVLAFVAKYAGDQMIDRIEDRKERYRRHQYLNTAVLVLGAAAIAVLWARLIENKSTFFGILGAGLAVALREPLLSIAARVAIFVGHIYSVGDRIEINKIGGDVIDVGFFYTRMLEIGNWISADQATGRIVQFSNSQIFGTPVYNYTQNFSYIWDEIQLPMTYRSNIDTATRIMLSSGEEYTREFLNKAEGELKQMDHYFLVPSVELKPHVYVSFDSNFVTLTMRYIVDPKKRRAAKSFLLEHILRETRERDDITYGSTTQDLTIHGSLDQSQKDTNLDRAA
ncbi:MAG TPA: mechanosensitive ion channel family protein [Terriglobales bacterium]|nr:mechanosensitive ion channel family protein [Terriglobales bacterium]